MMSYPSLSLQNNFLEALQPLLDEDTRIRAAWLEGSFGRGEQDRYSDIDLHLLVDKAALESFRAEAQAWLSAIRPLVLYKLLFDGAMVNAMTVDGLRLDMWLHGDATATVDPAKTRVLLDRDHGLQMAAPSPRQDAAAIAARLAQQMCEFWRCMGLLPTVIGRHELLVSLTGLAIEVNLITEIVIMGYGIERDSGVKRLNRYLPDDLRNQLETAVDLHGLSRTSLTAAHLRLARLMQEQGRPWRPVTVLPIPQIWNRPCSAMWHRS